MKALVISDVHSNFVALEAVWAQESDCDVVICLGDLVDYGPFPKRVLDWVRAHEVVCVQGNHDRWVVQRFGEGKTAVFPPFGERLFADHNALLLDEADIQFLAALPLTRIVHLDGVAYALTHLYRELDEIVSLHAFEQFRGAAFGNAAYDCLLLGHTHRQGVRYLSDEVLWLNPGSLSYRRRDDPDQMAHYAVIENGRFSLRRLAYDFSALRQAAVAMRPQLQVEERTRGVYRLVQ